jgi:tetratricopeptide (TPR) repeat protein
MWRIIQRVAARIRLAFWGRRLRQLRGRFQFREAIELGHWACDLAGRYLGEDHPRYASSLHALGELYGDVGDYGRAEAFLLSALTIRAGAAAADPFGLADNFHKLGLVYLESRNFGGIPPRR